MIYSLKTITIGGFPKVVNGHHYAVVGIKMANYELHVILSDSPIQMPIFRNFSIKKLRKKLNLYLKTYFISL